MKHRIGQADVERWLVVAAVAALAVQGVWVLGRVCAESSGLPLYDEAGQSFAGVRLARSLRAASPIAFLRELNDMVTWPFVHPLLLTPWFLVLGDGYGVAEMLSRWLWAGTALAACAAGWRLHPTQGAWVGLGAGVLVLVSPFYRVFATVGTIEMAGAFLLAATVACHARAIGDAARPGWRRAAGWTTTALFLCKYNYGLLWLVPFAVHEWWMLDAAKRARWVEGARAWWTAGAWRRPLPLVVVALVALMAAIAVSGGFELRAFGQRLSMRSLGNPAYATLVVLVLWAIVPWRKRRAQWRAVWSAMAPRQRTWLATIGLPLLVWFLVPYPNRVKAFFAFVTNRASGPAPWSVDWLLDYLRAFATHYAPVQGLGWFVLVLALVPPRLRGDAGRAARLVHMAALVGLAATTLHRYHEPRFLFTTALLLWLSAARTVVEWLAGAMALSARAARRSPAHVAGSPARAAGSPVHAAGSPVRATLAPDRVPRLTAPVARAAWLAAGIGWVAWAVAVTPAADRTCRDRAPMRGSLQLAAVADAVLDLAARDPDPIFLGYTNALSPALLQWQGQILSRDGRGPQPPEDWPWLAKGTPEAVLDARVEALRRAGRPIIAALPIAGVSIATAGHRDEVWADSAVVARLERRADVERVDRREIAAAGFAVSRFRWRDASAAMRE